MMNINSAEFRAAENLVNQSFNLLRNENLTQSDSHVVLFLLSLHSKRLLDNLRNHDDYLIKELLCENIESASTGDRKIFGELYNKIYSSIFGRISTKGFARLLQTLFQIDKKILHHNFPDLFERSVRNLQNGQGNLLGEVTLSNQIAEFASSLVSIPLDAKIYSPFAGAATFSISVKDTHSFYWQERNLVTWAIGTLRIIAHGKRFDSSFKAGDSLNEWNPFYEDTSAVNDLLVGNGKKEKYDLIISNPPFVLKHPLKIEGKYGLIRNAEAFLIEKGIESLNNVGKLVALISVGNLFRPGSDRELRKELVNSDLLEMVVSFPSGILLPYTGIKIAIIVLNKQKKLAGKVKFIDTSAFIKSKEKYDFELRIKELISLINSDEESNSIIIVNNNSIVEQNYDLSVNRYFDSLSNGVRLNDLMSIDRPFARHTNQSVDNLPKINFADLNNNIRLDYSRLKVELAKKNDILLNKSCFLLGTFNMQLKFTYFEFRGQMHLCSPNMIPLNIDSEKVTIPYFGKQLTEPYFIDQFRSFSKGSAYQKVSRTDLLNILMPVPSIAEQERQKEAIVSYFHESDKNLQLMISLEDQLHEQANYLRHSIAGPTRNILTFFEKMMLIIESNPDIKAKELAQSKLKPVDRYSFKDMREIVERDLVRIGDTVKNQLDIQEQVWNSKLEPMDIDAFLSDYAHNLVEAHPQIKILYESFIPYLLAEIDKTPYVTISGNQDLLRTMLDNLFDNARKHAFHESSENKFLINLDYDEDSGVLSIEVANSGMSFPKEIDLKGFITKNKKSNDSVGDGFGGWFISQVIKHHKGDFDIDDNSIFKPEIADGYSTSFHIKLPLLQE